MINILLIIILRRLTYQQKFPLNSSGAVDTLEAKGYLQKCLGAKD